jgi:uncharacterized protein (TIGR02687 family)
MNTSQITEALSKFFEESRIVFWNDPRGEFLESLESSVPESVAIIRPDELGALAAKIRIEKEEPETKFLVYSPAEEPVPKKDWLLDIRLYSKTFSADAASLYLNELGLAAQSLRSHIANRMVFFGSQDRRAKLHKWVTPQDTESDLDKKMLGIAVGADQAEIFSIFIRLFSSMTPDKEQAATLPGFHSTGLPMPSAWKDVVRFGLDHYFWGLAGSTFGYAADEPEVAKLLVHIFVSELGLHAGDKLPSMITPLGAADRTHQQNSSVFLANWRNNTIFMDRYASIARIIEKEIEAKSWLTAIPAELLHENETFEIVERTQIKEVRDRVMAPLPSDVSSLEKLINSRRDRYWCRLGGVGNSYSLAYNAMASALKFYEQKAAFREGFSFGTAAAIFRVYTDNLYKFDQYYRLFHENARACDLEGLRPLKENIENTYAGWFLDSLAIAWGKSVEHERLLENWRIDGVSNQQTFFRSYVHDLVKEAKVYVVISDALRFECAEELTRELNKNARKSGNAMHEAELTSMLGVVPSYTALGMASLLPYETLDYRMTNSGIDVTADEISTAGTPNRNAILGKVNGKAVQYDDLMKKSREEGREFVRDANVVYIYHNVIDATGDSASTEEGTFEAVRKSIDDLQKVVNKLFDWNGSHIIITSDHGFLFQQTPPQAADRSAIDIGNLAPKKKKKRYIIDPALPKIPNAWHGKIRKTAGIAGDMEFLIPKGANRFHFTGGARFVHGGAMPQEIVIPVVSVRKLRGQAAASSRVKRVGVTMLGNLTRIVNNVQKLRFIQTETVSDRNTPRTLQISIRDDIGSLITNEETVTFDSKSDSMHDRVKEVRLILKPGTYDRRKQYFIVLNDNDALVKEYSKLPITIDIAFSSDF